MIPRRAGLLALTLAAAAPPVSAADLHIDVSGLRSDRGDLRVALFRTPEDFPKSEGRFRESIVPARGGRVPVVFADVPPGTYAIAAFHDENGNGSFDRGLLGVPLEGYGFGNDARIGFGPPDFSDAAVTVDGEPVRVRFTIRYWLGGAG